MRKEGPLVDHLSYGIANPLMYPAPEKPRFMYTEENSHSKGELVYIFVCWLPCDFVISSLYFAGENWRLVKEVFQFEALCTEVFLKKFSRFSPSVFKLRCLLL